MTERQELLLECFVRCGGNSIMAKSAYRFIVEMEQNGTCTTTETQWPPSQYETETTPLSGEDCRLTTDESEGFSICFGTPDKQEDGQC